MQVDLSDTAIILSLKVDDPVRLQNLDLVRSFYAAVTRDPDVILVEQGTQAVARAEVDRVRHVALSPDGYHWKTRNLNRGAALTGRPFLLFADVDMVPDPRALDVALKALREGGDFHHVHDGIVVNLPRRSTAPPDWHAYLSAQPHFDPDSVLPNLSASAQDAVVLYGNTRHRATGGALLCKRTAFFDIGGYNENFVSFGFEDKEIHDRATKLGYDLPYAAGYNLYHIDHPRGPESRFGPFYRQNNAEIDRVSQMSGQCFAALFRKSVSPTRV